MLVDTTPDLRAQALRHDVRRVDAVLYTHSHADHLMGLDEIRRFNVLTGRAMPIYGDARTLASVRQTFSYVFESNAPKGGGVPGSSSDPAGKYQASSGHCRSRSATSRGGSGQATAMAGSL